MMILFNDLHRNPGQVSSAGSHSEKATRPQSIVRPVFPHLPSAASTGSLHQKLRGEIGKKGMILMRVDSPWLEARPEEKSPLTFELKGGRMSQRGGGGQYILSLSHQVYNKNVEPEEQLMACLLSYHNTYPHFNDMIDELQIKDGWLQYASHPILWEIAINKDYALYSQLINRLNLKPTHIIKRSTISESSIIIETAVDDGEEETTTWGSLSFPFTFPIYVNNQLIARVKYLSCRSSPVFNSKEVVVKDNAQKSIPHIVMRSGIDARTVKHRPFLDYEVYNGLMHKIKLEEID